MAFATTLMVAILHGNAIAAARIGDGSFYSWDGRKLARFCSGLLPADGTTLTITQPDWRRYTVSAVSERDFIQGLVLASDGADSLFLAEDEKGRQKPSPAQFERFAHDQAQGGSDAGVNAAVIQLNHRGHSDDDTTFILAIKPQSAAARPAPRPQG